ncbi:MAG: CPBP family intramembrane metalloprotease [Candidatus Margulisbacteria bacterium]|nr:CPBP family intramembrane metalloprotease [Candidatus Margulisiibacteriota bacterium]
MKTIMASIKNHPVLTYFIIAYAISWGGILWVMAQAGFKIFSGMGVFEKGLQGMILVSWLSMLAGPSIAGLLMTWLADGKSGLKQLLARFLTWRVAFKWYAAALFIFPALLVIVIYPLSLLSPAFTLGSAFALGIFAGLIGGSIEEIGWTGFALPKLQLKYTPLAAGVILAVVHAFWHFLGDFWGGFGTYQGYYLLHFSLWIICFIPYRLISVWIYNRTQSLWLGMLTHASFTGSQLALTPTGASVEQGLIWYALFILACSIVAVIVVRQDRQMFLKKPA